MARSVREWFPVPVTCNLQDRVLHNFAGVCVNVRVALGRNSRWTREYLNSPRRTGGVASPVTLFTFAQRGKA